MEPPGADTVVSAGQLSGLAASSARTRGARASWASRRADQLQGRARGPANLSSRERAPHAGCLPSTDRGAEHLHEPAHEGCMVVPGAGRHQVAVHHHGHVGHGAEGQAHTLAGRSPASHWLARIGCASWPRRPTRARTRPARGWTIAGAGVARAPCAGTQRAEGWCDCS